jgi:hypothetical protein
VGGASPQKFAALDASSSSSSSDDDADDEMDTSESPAPEVAHVPRGQTKHSLSETADDVDAPPLKKHRSSEPFRRINPDEVEFLDERLKDNSFNAKYGANGSYGEKAFKDLSVTRGKGFRHEKTKKKRGSYRGGAIDTGVHSIKFGGSDEE